MRDRHDFIDFDVPPDIGFEFGTLFHEARGLLYQRAAVERNSLTSAGKSSDVGLVCATLFIMAHGAGKARPPNIKSERGI